MHMEVGPRKGCGCEGCRRFRDTQRLFRLIALVFSLAVLTLAAVLCIKAHASTGPSQRWRGYERALARIVVAEADGSVQDWSAILWTLDHRIVRYGDTPARTMSYSATTHSPLPRAQSIHLVGITNQANPWGDHLVTALAHVKAWMQGSVPDPCPEALHWHGTCDSTPGWFEQVICGETRNSFGKLRLRRK